LVKYQKPDIAWYVILKVIYISVTQYDNDFLLAIY
jgi:hypothetical protein